MGVIGVVTSAGVGGADADVSRSWGKAADMDVGVAVMEVCRGSRNSEDVEEGVRDAASHFKRLVEGSLVAVVTSVTDDGSKIVS